MPTYYAVVPGHEELSAEITAPDKRHGRTVYLDHLSRNNLIPYSERGMYRKAVRLDKIQPGSVQTSIQLRYGDGVSVQSVPEQVVEELPQQVPQQEMQSEVVSPYPQQTDNSMASRVKPTTANSPIMNLSKRMGGH